MSHNSQEYPSTLYIQSQFQEELAAVEEKLSLAFSELYTPLSGLVRSQVQQAKPHLRAAVVLVAAHSPDGDSQLREKRLFLATALEMLYVALNVHQLLLNNRTQIEDTIDKSVLGSTILAGDYCFSFAASLAARTDSAEVVAIFSQTLQAISERQLRSLFDPSQPATAAALQESEPFDASAELFQAGIQAANALVKLDSRALDAHAEMVQSLIAQLLHRKISLPIQESLLNPTQKAYWSALVQWHNQ